MKDINESISGYYITSVRKNVVLWIERFNDNSSEPQSYLRGKMINFLELSDKDLCLIVLGILMSLDSCVRDRTESVEALNYMNKFTEAAKMEYFRRFGKCSDNLEHDFVINHGIYSEYVACHKCDMELNDIYDKECEIVENFVHDPKM